MKARLIESFEIAPEVKHFRFDVPGVTELPYLPGQFVSLTRNVDGREITRAYSTASAPHGNEFELCLNRVSDGLFSPFLFTMNPGDSVDMKGPLGYFTWRNPMSDSILVATGTGIAPFRGMLQDYLPSGAEREITLLYGVRYESSLLYRTEFEALESQFPNFHFVPTLTRPGETWRGRVGRVQSLALEALGDRRDMDVYICGMKAMVDEVRTMLKQAGLDRRRIVVEKYD